MTRDERTEYQSWIYDLVHSLMHLITSGNVDPSAAEIANEFYKRVAMPNEVAVVKEALRDMIEFATDGVDEEGEKIWGLGNSMLTPLCDDYYDGVYIPYKTQNGRIRKRKIVLRNISLADRAFIDAQSRNPEICFSRDFATMAVPLGGGKKYAGVYYTNNPMQDEISRRWLHFMAQVAEGTRIKTQRLIRSNGGSEQLEADIFREADDSLSKSGRIIYPQPRLTFQR